MNLVDLTAAINDKIIDLRSRLYGITNVLLDESNQVKQCSPMAPKANDGIGVNSTLEDALVNLSSMDAVISGIESKMGQHPPKNVGYSEGRFDGHDDGKFQSSNMKVGQTTRVR